MLNNLELSIFVPISEVHSNNTSIGLQADGFHWVYGDGIIDPKNITDLDYECRPVNGGVFTPPNTNTTIKLGKRQEILDALALYSIQLTGKQVDITINGKLFKTRIGSWSMDARYISLECSSAYLFNDVQLPLSNGDYVYGIAINEFEVDSFKLNASGFNNTRIADNTYGIPTVSAPKAPTTPVDIRQMRNIEYSPIFYVDISGDNTTIGTLMPYNYAVSSIGKRLYITNTSLDNGILITQDILSNVDGLTHITVPTSTIGTVPSYGIYSAQFTGFPCILSSQFDNSLTEYAWRIYAGQDSAYTYTLTGRKNKEALETICLVYILEDVSKMKLTQYELGTSAYGDVGYNFWLNRDKGRVWGFDNNEAEYMLEDLAFITGVNTILPETFINYDSIDTPIYCDANSETSDATIFSLEDNNFVVNIKNSGVSNSVKFRVVHNFSQPISPNDNRINACDCRLVVEASDINSGFYPIIHKHMSFHDYNDYLIGFSHIDWIQQDLWGGVNQYSSNFSVVIHNDDNVFEGFNGLFLPSFFHKVHATQNTVQDFNILRARYAFRITVVDIQGIVICSLFNDHKFSQNGVSLYSDDTPFVITAQSPIYNKLIEGISWEAIKRNAIKSSDIAFLSIDLSLISEIEPNGPPLDTPVFNLQTLTGFKQQINILTNNAVCVGPGNVVFVAAPDAEPSNAPLHSFNNRDRLDNNNFADTWEGIPMDIYSPAELVIKAIYGANKGEYAKWGVDQRTVTYNEMNQLRNASNVGIVLNTPTSQFTVLDNICAQTMQSAYINENGTLKTKSFILDKYRDEEVIIGEDSIVVDSISYRYGSAPITSYSFSKDDYKVNISNVLESSFPEKNEYSVIETGAYQWTTYATYAENLYLGTKTPFLYLIAANGTPPKEGLVFKATSKFDPSKVIVFKVFAPKLNGPTWEIPIKILSQSGTALNIYEELDPIINVNENPTWQSYVSLPNTDSNYLLALNIWTEAKNASRHTLDNTQLPSKYTKFDNVLRVSDVNNLILWTVQHNSYQKTFVNFSVPMALMDSLGFELMSWVKIDFGIYKNKPQAGWITKISYDLANHQIHCEFMSALSDEDVLVYNENIENWAAEMVLNESTGNIPQILINENMVP